jgi:lipid II isoglutaminyl synthase (glutamine-hydrolysing)
MIIEWLNPQGTMLFGDRGNLDLLLKIYPHASLINTPLFDVPAFTNTHVDLVCVGSMNERMQDQMINWLTPHKEAIVHRVMNDLGCLWFGNSWEILGHNITRKEHEILGLDLYPFTVTQESIKRYNALVGIETKYGLILGHKSTFSMISNTEPIPSFGKVVNGFGHNLSDPLDGLHDHHMIASSLMGPLLVLNPHFTKQYLQEITKQEVVIPFEDDLVLAYEAKKQEFENSKHFIYDK